MRIEMADPFSQKHARDRALQDKLTREQNEKNQRVADALGTSNRIKQKELQGTSDKPYPWPKKFYHP